MGRKPNEVAWDDAAEQLRRRYAAERHPLRRQRLAALVLLREGATTREAAARLGVSPRTIQRWVALYRTGGTEEVVRRVLGHRAGRPSRLTPDQLAILAARARAGAFPAVADAVAWVRAEWGVEYSYKGMHALLARLRYRAPQGTSGPGRDACAVSS